MADFTCRYLSIVEICEGWQRPSQIIFQKKILIIAWKVYLRESRLEAGRLYNSLGVGWQDLHNTTSPEEVFNNFMLIVCYFTWCIYHNTLTLLFFLIYILLGSIDFIFYLRLNFPWRIKEKYVYYMYICKLINLFTFTFNLE